MKTLTLIFLLLASTAYADITLTIPLEVTPPVTKVKIKSMVILDDRVLTMMSYQSASNVEVQAVECELTGSDYNQVMNNAVACPTDDTKTFYNQFKKKVQNKCKNKLNLTGTEN